MAAALLRNGTHVLGVLNADWEHAGACNAPTRSLLENLAERFAMALSVFSTHELFKELERFLPAETRSESKADLLVTAATLSIKKFIYLK